MPEEIGNGENPQAWKAVAPGSSACALPALTRVTINARMEMLSEMTKCFLKLLIEILLFLCYMPFEFVTLEA
jgi:hypothetical protein